MADVGGADSRRRVRRWRSVTEKRRIVELTMEPGASVAEVARGYGVNANQVFKWRRAFERGELNEPSAAMLPVSVSRWSAPAIVAVDPTEERRAVEGAIISRSQVEPRFMSSMARMQFCCDAFLRACTSDRAAAGNQDMAGSRRD